MVIRNTFVFCKYMTYIGARTDVRENSGKLPIDMLKATASGASRGTLLLLP